jgi:hypothetical protein
MVTSTININKDCSSVWAGIEAEFCKTFNITASDLPKAEIKVQTRSFYGEPIEVLQKVTEYIPGQAIAISSVNGHDIVTSQYKLNSLGDAQTKVSLSVVGKNDASPFKNWNYFLMGLPILRSGTKKRLAMQLGSLKTILEEGE